MIFDAVLLVRILWSAALGFAIGWEREYRGSKAGDRTFALVALGAAAFTAAGVEKFPASAEKVMAGIVTGIGFLGAGMIMRGGDDREIRGLTTAAALWSVAAVGMLAGIGEVIVAALVTVLVLVLLEIEYVPVLRRLHPKGDRERQPNEDARD